jgi:hypothetical protein
MLIARMTNAAPALMIFEVDELLSENLFGLSSESCCPSACRLTP